MQKYYNSTWEQERDKRYIFHTICESKMRNLCKIHPLNQRDVNQIYEAIYTDPRVAMIIIFGSSLNMRCNAKSDIDIAIKLKEGFITSEVKSEVSEKIQIACNWKADILWRDRLDESDRVLHDIRKGVELK